MNSHDHSTPDPLKRSMVRLADTVRSLHVIGYRIRNGLSTDQLPDPVFRDHDYVGQSHRVDSNRDHIINGLYNPKCKPRIRRPYVPYL